ncbi:MAG TPA: DUF427 domain-containing protein [Acidimicrobiales bacterium]
MTLTGARGPLGPKPSGRFVPPVNQPTAYVEPFRRRVRGLVGERPVVDSESVLLVHRPGQAPAFAFPAPDVSVVNSRPLPEVEGYVTVPWDAVEAWYEEEERIEMHPRNPYHRVDCVRTTRRLRVEVHGEVLVDTNETMGVYETSLEPRLYVRKDQVLGNFLFSNPTTETYCPYKGFASYWNAVIGGVVIEDAAWSYEDPLPESTAIRGMLCFDENRVSVSHDLPAPATP